MEGLKEGLTGMRKISTRNASSMLLLLCGVTIFSGVAWIGVANFEMDLRDIRWERVRTSMFKKDRACELNNNPSL